MFYNFTRTLFFWFSVYYLKLLDYYMIGVTGYMCGTLYKCDLEDSRGIVYANPNVMIKEERCVGRCCDGYKVRILFEKIEVKSTHSFEED